MIYIQIPDSDVFKWLGVKSEINSGNPAQSRLQPKKHEMTKVASINTKRVRLPDCADVLQSNDCSKSFKNDFKTCHNAVI